MITFLKDLSARKRAKLPEQVKEAILAHSSETGVIGYDVGFCASGRGWSLVYINPESGRRLFVNLPPPPR